MSSLPFRTALGVVAIMLVLVVSVQSKCRDVGQSAPPMLLYKATGKGSCVYTRVNDQSILFTNGVNNAGECILRFWTREPAEATFTINSINFLGSESMSLKTVRDESISITAADVLSTFKTAVANNKLKYQPDTSDLSTTFEILITSVASPYSSVCSLKSGEKGKLSLFSAGHGPDVYSQAWISSPKNCVVKATINRAFLGSKNAYGNCDGDAYLINDFGEPAYSNKNTVAYCDDDANFSVTSNTNIINFLIFAKAPGQFDVDGNVTVTCT